MSGRILRRLAFVAVLAAAFAMPGELRGQHEDEKEDAPVWPASGQVPPGMEDQYVFLSEDGHSIVLRIPVDSDGSEDNQYRVARLSLHNDLEPSVRAEFERPSPRFFRYRYRVCNGPSAADRIESFSIPRPLAQDWLCMKHEPERGGPWAAPCWEGRVPEFRKTGKHLRKTWLLHLHFYPEDTGIGAGECLGGFILESDFLPGIKTGIFSALMSRMNEEGVTWPREVQEQFGSLTRHSWFERYVPTIGPQFPPGMPRPEIADHFRKEIKRLAGEGWLDPDSDFVQELMERAEELTQRPEAADAFSMEAAPAAPLEKEILSAMKLSLRHAAP